MDGHNGEIKRCSSHGPLHPWAENLDPAKVREYHLTHAPDAGAYVVDFELLRTTCQRS
jgi:hypothetical protein